MTKSTFSTGVLPLKSGTASVLTLPGGCSATKSSNTDVLLTHAMYDSCEPTGASKVTVALPPFAAMAGTSHAFTPSVRPHRCASTVALPLSLQVPEQKASEMAQLLFAKLYVKYWFEPGCGDGPIAISGCSVSSPADHPLAAAVPLLVSVTVNVAACAPAAARNSERPSARFKAAP